MPVSGATALCGAALLSIAATINSGQSPASRADRASSVDDSVLVNVANTMPHPWDFFHDTAASATPIGHVDAQSFATVIIRDVQGDSVTLYAVSSAMGRTSHTFATHSTETQVWRF